MKAWFVQNKGDGWGTFLHAETRSKAISRFINMYLEADEWCYIRARRTKDYDDKPINYENMLLAYKNGGMYYSNGYGEDGYDEVICEKFFINECYCDICKNA